MRHLLLPSLAGMGLLCSLSGCSGPSVGMECDSSRDCSSSGLVCDLSRRECVECVSDADCLEEGQLCLARSCREVTPCESSRQCPGQVCDPSRGYCVDCASDVDCPEGMRCEQTECVEPPPPCSSDRECSALGLVCDASDGVCVECVRDADCTGGLRCGADHRCQALGCTAGAMECADESHTRTCGSDGSWGDPQACEAGQVCVDGSCSDGSCDPACGTGESCTEGSCACGDGPGCGEGERCVDGGCEPQCPVCRAGEGCVDGECRCGTGPSCRTGEQCDAGICVPIPCSPDCTGDEVCTAGQCRCGDGPRCDSGTVCEAGACVASACSPSCDVGETCDSGTCRCGTGPACGSSEICSSGECVVSTCEESPCKLVSPQCGCSGGQACDVDRASSARICRAPGSAGEAESCEAASDCAAGFHCAGSSGATFCLRFCDTDAECTSGDGSHCTFQLLDGSGEPIPGSEVCSISCDPLKSAGCPSNAVCRIAGVLMDSDQGVTHCGPTGFPFPGLPCGSDADCGAGYDCRGICEAYCRVGQADCASSETCTPYSEPIRIFGHEWGTCRSTT